MRNQFTFKLFAFCASLLLLGIPQSSSATPIAVARFAAALGFITASNALYNSLGDYEESRLSAGVEIYESDVYYYYFGFWNRTIRRNWIDHNGSNLYSTESHSPTGSSTHAVPFTYVPERRNYNCTKYGFVNGSFQMTMSYIADVNTIFWANHEVTKFANNAINSSPSTFAAHMRFTTSALSYSCDDVPSANQLVHFESWTQPRNNRKWGIPLISGDYEVVAFTPGFGWAN